MSFTDIFFTATRQKPYEYQRKLAEEPWPDTLDIPTGLGKTAAVALAWIHKRRILRDSDTPRRLVWCLPMRVLVEQTVGNVRTWLGNLELLGEVGEGRISVHTLMGGESDLKSWAEHPEEEMILIGTQDMLLSRVLMRGYGMSRYQWPVHFALLHNDCLWAFDEVQLMGAGLATSAQLEAFRRRHPLGCASRSLWLSATLNRDWLATVDLAPHLPDFTTLGLDEADRAQAGERLNARKALAPAGYLDALCEEVLAAHAPTAQTLVILNRVDRAQGLYQRLRKARPAAADLLIHARFRPAERRAAEARLREGPGRDRILVATQAIEAGVDLSSKVLFTELAPWPSLVQRLGRCNRYGEHNDDGARVYWMDLTEDADPLPYQAEDLAPARERLATLTDAGPANLPPSDGTRPLTAVLRRKDLLDLFNTDPDLSGFDVDVSDYIRDSGTPGLHLFWRPLTDGDPNTPAPQPAPGRDELCPVGIAQAQALSKRKDVQPWRWDSLAGRWEPLQSAPRPGQTLLLDAAAGGYDPALGASPASKAAVPEVPSATASDHESYDADWRSRGQHSVALADHLGHVAQAAAELCAAVGETEHAAPITRAGRWHDLGKSHPVFDATMHRCPEAPAGPLAKSNCPGPLRHERSGFRHELASALAWLAAHDDPARPDPETDLVAYLIAAHHGKVRTSLRALPTEPAAPFDARYARGIWEGDRLPALAFDGEQSLETQLCLALMELGEGEQGRSWGERTLGLLAAHGPFRLAWLETLVRLADWRASAAEQAGAGDSNDG
jgi:CRISPR-associated endonuclease/helicase Cas3